MSCLVGQFSLYDQNIGDRAAGNLFISFFAGHETLTDTIAFVLTLLAIHPTEQELVYQEIRDVSGGVNIPVSVILSPREAVMSTLTVLKPLSAMARLTRVSAYVIYFVRASNEFKFVPQGNERNIADVSSHYCFAQVQCQ